MDTPDSKTPSSSNHNKNNAKLINPSSSDSPAVQDSPVFNFLSNLSPIQLVKAAPVAQGFPGLASPPLIFASPPINLQTNFLNRQLQSSTSNSEFSEEKDKCQKNDGLLNDSAKVDLSLKTPSTCDDEIGRSRKNSVHVPHHTVSSFLDGYLANPTDSTCSLNKRLFVDSPQSSEGVCLVEKDNVTLENKVVGGSTLAKTLENAQAQPRAKFKLVKLEPRRLISTSSKCFNIFPKLSSCHSGKVSQLECGSLRRCLFDENQRKYSSDDGSDLHNPCNDLTSIQEVSNTSSGTVERRQKINLSKPMTGVSASPTSRNCPAASSKPLGIGLHLNSVVYPRSTNNAMGGQQSSEKVVRVPGKTSVYVTNNQSAGKVNAKSVTTDLIERGPTCSEGTHKNEDLLATTSVSTVASNVVEHVENPILLKPDDPSAILHDKRKFNLEPVETDKKLLGSPKKKRKKSSSTPDTDTSKRCNCKKSKCLKLYCDCFAAGLYCAESCACQGCFNRAEYEDTVLETRQQIESRNPLAFVPKVVQLVTNSPARGKELGNLSTPSSARHKRGCSCKRSMCLKKYCECYQSNVGCSNGCRCEGCKNVYGQREDHSFGRQLVVKKVTNATQGGSILDEKEEGLSGSSDYMKSRLHCSLHVSPITPALQCSDQKKYASKSCLPLRGFLQSPDSDQDMLPSETLAACPENLPSNSILLEETERSVDDMSSSKPMDLRNVSGPETSGSGPRPPSGLLRWRSSPMTPVTESARSEYLQDFDSGSKHSHMLEDDTPEILKESATPSHSVKMRSPIKKRVSPPYHHKASPDSLKICHKYVLQAVSRFPPLTPYSRKSGNDNTSDSLD